MGCDPLVIRSTETHLHTRCEQGLCVKGFIGLNVLMEMKCSDVSGIYHQSVLSLVKYLQRSLIK